MVMTLLLLADDDAATCSALALLIHTRLEVSGIVTAHDWDHLLELARTELPDVILFDWELPGCLAHEGLAALRMIVPLGKIIAMSARPEALQDALQAGVDAFLAKSVPPERVLDVIQRFVSEGENPVAGEEVR